MQRSHQNRRMAVDREQKSQPNRRTAVDRGQNLHPYRRPVAAAIVFALVPWITLGFGSALAFAFAAVFLRGLSRLATAGLWASSPPSTTLRTIRSRRPRPQHSS